MYRNGSFIAMLCILFVACGLVITEVRIENKKENPIVFSHESGFYDEPFELSLRCGGGTIYYTLDGTEPDNTSLKYDESIHIADATVNENVYSRITDTSIGYQYDRAKQYFVSLATPWYTVPGFNVDKCNVVKACCYDKNGKRSNTVTKIYFVGFAEKEGYDNLNIMSIVCSPNDLFDYENGIYVCGKDMDEYLAGGDIAVNWAWWKGNYSRRHRNGERLATAVLFNTEGEIVFDKQIGVRIQGNSSRALMPKNLNLFLNP